jgi:Protein of unknown function (DUF789)
MLFTYYCDANYMQLNPCIFPHLSMLDHYLHQHHCHSQIQQNLRSSCDRDKSAPVSFVAPLLLELNVEVNAANDCIDERSQSGHPSTSLVTLPCYFLTNRPEASNSSSLEFNSTVNLIADTIVKSLKSSSVKENSEKGNSDKGSDENGSFEKANSKISSRKNSKKKKNRKKGGTEGRPSKTQTKSQKKLSNEPCVSSDSSSSSHVEITSVAEDGCDQRVKSDTETILRCFSNNISDKCHTDVSCSSSILSNDEGENTKPALSKTFMHAGDAKNEDLSVFEKRKADTSQCNSNACINNEFTLVAFGKRRQYDRISYQDNSHPSQCTAFSGYSGDQFSTWQNKSSEVAIQDKSASHIKYFKQRHSETETLMAVESIEKIENSSKSDNSGSVSRHLGEYVFKKDDFPSLPSPDNGLKVVRGKVHSRLPRKEELKNPHVPLPKKALEQCKESESEVGVDIKFSIPNLKVTIGAVEESSSGSGSSSGAFFSPDSPKSAEMNQSSHNTTGTDSPRSSRSSDEMQVRSDMGHSDTSESHNVSQSGGNIFTSNDKSITDVTPQSGCGICPLDLNNDALFDIDAFKSGPLMCSSPAGTTPILPNNSMSCLGESNNMLTIFNRDLGGILSAVRAAHRVYQRVELVQATLGGPLADYELLCHCAAPVIDLPPRQILDIPLQSIWQWYEEPSCYALEVKECQDHQRLMNFSAHFVPSLSAVQLFVRRGPSETFSKHMPKQDGLEFAPSVDDVLGVNAGSAELVFEFFENEQPYLRQTLFGK